MTENNETAAAPTLSKPEIMKKIGAELAERRKLRKLNITSVSQALKIRSSFIEALENGLWDELPGEVYVRGFLVRYAQYLGLNGQRMIAPYLEAQQKTGTLQAAPVSKSAPIEAAKGGWVWLGVGILVLIGLIKFVSDPGSTPSMPAPIPTPSAAPEVEPSTNKSESQTAQHRLEIFTPAQLWLRVETKDRKFEGIIPDGSSWSIKGNGEFRIHMGHTRQVAMKFDDQVVELDESQKKFNLPK